MKVKILTASVLISSLFVSGAFAASISEDGRLAVAKIESQVNTVMLEGTANNSDQAFLKKLAYGAVYVPRDSKPADGGKKKATTQKSGKSCVANYKNKQYKGYIRDSRCYIKYQEKTIGISPS